MRVLITGASGFVGRHLAPKLIAAGHEVCGIHLDEGEPLSGVREKRVDILDTAALGDAISDFEPEAVIHLAGLSHVGKSWDHMGRYFAVNVIGVENVLAASSGARMILASSSEVYGPVPASEQPIGTSQPPAPQNPYALTKAAAERLVLASGGIVARMFNLVGPGQESSFALPGFAKRLAERLEEDPVVLEVGNLDAQRDFLHVEDGADAFVTLIERGEPGAIYNLGSGTPFSIREALEKLIEITQLNVVIEVDAERFRPVDLPLLWADTSKLEALGWLPRRDITQALEEIWQGAVEFRTPVRDTA